MAKQQLRWARGSQYNTARMLPWMLRNARTLAFFYVCDIVLPFLLVCTITGWVFRASRVDSPDIYGAFVAHYGRWVALGLMITLSVVMSTASSAIRQARHLKRRPDDLLRLPAFILISTFFLMPIRLFGFTRMGHNSGWGTRSGGYSGERNRNPLAAIPYLIAVAIVVAGTVLPS
jgi:hyaluronan synthase